MSISDDEAYKEALDRLRIAQLDYARAENELIRARQRVYAAERKTTFYRKIHERT